MQSIQKSSISVTSVDDCNMVDSPQPTLAFKRARGNRNSWAPNSPRSCKSGQSANEGVSSQFLALPQAAN